MPTTADYVSLANLTSLTAGSVYTALVSVKRDSDAPTIRISASGTESSTISSTVWTDVFVTFTATGTDYIRLIPQTNAGGRVAVDRMQIVVGTSAGTFFDGSTSAAGDFTYAWSGSANQSTSRQRGLSVVASANAGVNGGTGVRSQTQYRTGTSSTIVNAPYQNSGVVTSLISSLTASFPYTASAWVLGESGKTVYLRLEELTSADASVGSTNGTAVTMTGSWQRISATRSFGATGVKARVSVLNGATTSQTFYYDNLMLEQSPVLQDYFDGTDTSTDSDLTVVWTGTANASTSALQGAGSNTYEGFNGGAVISTTAQKFAGTRSAKVYYSFASTAGDNGLRYSRSLQGSTTYTVSAWVFTPVGSTLPQFSIRGAGFTTVNGSPATTNNAWQRISATFTTTDTQTYDILLVNSAAAAVDTFFYVDNILVENSPILRDYFDGTSTSLVSDVPYSWSGTANNSTSVQTAPALTLYTPTGVGTAFAQTSTAAYSGIRSAYVVALGVDHGLVTSDFMTVTANTSYTASAWVRGESGKTLTITLSEFTSGDVLVGTTTAATTTATGSWQLISVSRGFGASGVKAKMSVLSRSSVQHEFYADALMLADSAYSGIYFDGSFTDSNGFIYDWTGTPNASSSTLVTDEIYAQNLATNPSMDAVTPGSTILRTNLLTNANMEADPWSDYSADSNASSSTTEAKDGTLSTKITPSASGIRGAKTTISSVSAGVTYTFSAWALRESGESSLAIQIQWISGSTPLTLSSQTFSPAPLDTWSRLFITAVAPDTATSAEVSVVFTSAVAASDVAYIDSALFEQTDQLRDYFDGSTTDALGWNYEWVGTQDESTSTAKASAVVFRTNLVTNPSFETNTTGWTASSSSIARTTSQYYVGSACLLVTPSASNGGAVSPLATTTPSATHTVSAWVRGSAGDNIRLELNERTSGDTTLVGTTTTNLTLTGAWQRISATRLFGTTGATANFSITNTSSTSLFFIDATMLEMSATLNSFFDGSSGATGNAFINSWTGTANLSTSTQSGAAVASAASLVGTDAAVYQSLSSGNKALRYQVVNGSASVIRGSYIIGNTLAAGKTYTVLGTITANLTSSIEITLRPDVSAATNQTTLGTLNLSAGTPTTFRFVGVASATGSFGSSSGLAFSTVARHPGGTSYTVDNLLVVEGTYIESYFDGDTAPNSDYSTEWVGTPHASVSTINTTPVAKWTGVFGANVYRSTQQIKSGLYSGKVVCNGTIARQGVHLYSFPTTSPSNNYTASVWILAESGKNIQIGLQEKTATGAPVGLTLGSNTSATGSWQRLSVTRSFGSTGAQADVFVYNVDATTNIMYIDEALVELSSSPQDYFDGNLGSSGDFSYAWTGSPNESTSYAYGVGVNAVDVGPGRVVVQSTDWANTRSRSARIIPISGATGTDSELGAVVAGTNVTSDAVLLERNQTYTILATLRLNATQTGTIDSSRARRVWFSLDGGATVSSSSSQSANAAGIYSHSLTFTTTSSGDNQVYLGSGTEAGGGDAWWDSVAIVKGVYAGSYFDGSLPNSGDLSYVWDGLEEESTSNITVNPVKNWTGINGAIVYQNSSEKFAGAKSALVLCSGTVGLQGVRLIDRATVSSSTQYFASAYIKGEAGKVVTLGIEEWTLAGTYIGSTTTQNITATGSWQRVSVSRVIGATGARANVVVSNVAAVAHTFYVDSVLLEASSTLQDYFDGSFPASGDFSYTWNGDVDGSTSQYQAASVNAVTASGALAVQSSDWVASGRNSLRIISTATSNNVSHADLTSFITAGLEPGKTYTVMAKAFRAEPGAVVGSLAYQGFVGTTLTQNVTAQIPTAAGVHDVMIVFTVNNDIEAAYLRVYNNQQRGSADIWIDTFMIVEGEYTGDYFDGDSDSTAGAFPILYLWNGTPHDSTSVRDIGGAIPAGGAAILSPYGDAERVNSTSALEIKYRSGWLG